tara:strand:- start:266 stop:1045 length:780 start_codon:yes stop_codon:yes gene_type:complete
LSPILLIYFLCFFFFILDTYLLEVLFSEYNDIEPEYRPVEQATRLAYLLVAVIAWRDLQKNKQNIETNALQTGKTLLFFSIILVILENNWDLTLRESIVGRIIFALTLGSVLVWLSWLAFNSDWPAPSGFPLLYILVLGILGLGQTVDAFHDGIVSNEAAQEIGTNITLEETTELFAAWVLFHAAWIWHNRDPEVINFWQNSDGLKLLGGLLLLGVGNGFLAFTREGTGGHFVSSQVAMLGVLFIILGICLTNKYIKVS